MKLLGVEFRDYGKFDRCFVPLGTGIELLVGKNNSGKTSILRALSTLAALPFGNPGRIAPEVIPYVRAQGATPVFGIQIHFSYEDEDKTFLGADPAEWSTFSQAKKRTWIFSFIVYPQTSNISFRRLNLKCDDQEIVIVHEYSGVFYRSLYDGRGIAVSSNPVPLARTEGPPTGSERRQIIVAENLFSKLPQLMNIRFVHAHRIIKPNLNLQALDTLVDTADSLAPFLDTILSNDRDTFAKIEKVVTNIFPEFKLVNPEKSSLNTVSITLTQQKTGEKIPLTHCGTGVEQVLALATFVLHSAPGTLILLDEPHSYLHPIAERQILSFILAHPEHRYVIATHSAILINSVSPDRILALGEENVAGVSSTESAAVPAILHSLGYKNSDLLFHDRLIMVEGESDQDILSLLLALNPLVSKSDLAKTGFPVMGGEGKLRSNEKQRSLLYWEKFLFQLGRTNIPRIYLFDGDCLDEDRKLLGRAKVFEAETTALLRFLGTREIENYLLVPEAILEALKEMKELQEEKLNALDASTIKQQIEEVLSLKENQKIYPDGPGQDSFRTAKGSVVLEKLFANFNLRYEKRRVGRLIATKISQGNQPLLKEIWDLFPLSFLPHGT